MASDPTFENRDPNSPGFWDERFDQRLMPWDQAGMLEAFTAFIGLSQDKPKNVLIPGCGSAYEARFLAECGCPVRAIDFSPSGGGDGA